MVRHYKQKVVVLDFDDTVVDFLGFLCRLHNCQHGTCVTQSDIKAYDFDKMKMKDARGNEVTGKELYQTFLEFEDHGLYSSLELLPDARTALKFFKTFGYKIIILTARDEKYAKETVVNKVRLNINYDEIIFCPSELKVKKVKELQKTYNIQLFADDKASTVREVAENCRVNHVICVNKAHNQEEELPEEVIRVNSLFDSVRLLKDISGNPGAVFSKGIL